MTLYAGIDGGQSSTVAVVGDARAVLGRGTGPPADLVGETRSSTRREMALDAALRAALETARLPANSRFDAIVAGLSGFDAGEIAPPNLLERTARMRTLHDSVVAHAGVLGGYAGIVVIAGTGSVALGNDDVARERFIRAGGWGPFFGDEGSGLWMARTALRRAMQRFDCGERSDLAARALVFFGMNSLRALQHAVAHADIARAALATFAAEVVTAATLGDRDAQGIVKAAATELAGLARIVDRRLAPVSLRVVSYAGGLFANAFFLETFGETLQAVVPHANLIDPMLEPAQGALILARQLP